MAADQDRIKQRVKKLLNLGGDGSAFEGEIENAMRLAAQLMDEHHLTEEDLSDTDVGSQGPEMGTATAFGGGRNRATWECILAHAICDSVGGIKYYIDTAVRRDRKTGILVKKNGQAQMAGSFVFYGIAEDVALATDLFDEFRQTIATMGDLKWGGVYRGQGRSYCEGFSSALHAREKTRQRRERQAACTAIVVRKADEATKWLSEAKGIKVRKSSGGGRGGQHFGDAYSDGRSDGSRANLSGQRRGKLPGGRRSLPR